MRQIETEQKHKPTVAFVLYAYNEERFIREAVESAFAQTYSPLEVVLSDDGSTDNTFKIVQEMAEAYQGPHKIILNRNERNIGIGSQLNAAYAKAQGVLFVLANADDISYPNRVEKIVDAWLHARTKVAAITTEIVTIDEFGNLLGSHIQMDREFQTLEDGVRNRFSGSGGAVCLAVTREVFSYFGPLLPTLILEDAALHLRIKLLGGRIHLKEPLVKYRIHQNNISQAYAVDAFDRWKERFYRIGVWQRSEGVKAYTQMLADICSQSAESWSDIDRSRARWIVMEKLIENEILSRYYSGDRAVSLAHEWQTLWAWAKLLFKLSMKRIFPILEYRSLRWNYRSALKASK